MRSRCCVQPEVLRFWALPNQLLLLWLLLLLTGAGGAYGMTDAEIKGLR
jgi:hypothetical protein